ncbi:hypothetical protein JOL62DRAFT_557210 [Phyllosticta paracitricarpa]|uniref:Uncharacterized protein n=1 Tax=Phyllosticta paracitricarpa TaxID=2016321 RepID=A0ABR1N582_9PEZI
MSNQGYYQGGPQYPPQSYGPPQPGYGQPPYGGYPQQPVPSPTSPWIQAPSLTRSVQMQYQQGPPQQFFAVVSSARRVVSVAQNVASAPRSAVKRPVPQSTNGLCAPIPQYTQLTPEFTT